MATFQITADKVSRELRRRARGAKREILRGIRSAAVRGRTEIVGRTNEADKVYLGHFKNAWRILSLGGDKGWELVNDAPHAGIVERGARPHKVGMAAVEAIREWVRRKGLRVSVGGGKPRALTASEAADDPVVNQMTWAIVQKIEREGQRPTFLVRDALPTLLRQLQEEVEDDLRRFANEPPGGSQ